MAKVAHFLMATNTVNPYSGNSHRNAARFQLPKSRKHHVGPASWRSGSLCHATDMRHEALYGWNCHTAGCHRYYKWRTPVGRSSSVFTGIVVLCNALELASHAVSAEREIVRSCPVASTPDSSVGRPSVDEPSQSLTHSFGVHNQIGTLIEQTLSRNPVVRAKAAYDLGRMGAQAAAAVPPLIRLLNDTEVTDSMPVSPSVLAAEALRQIGRPSAPALIDALSDESPLRRGYGASILGHIRDQSAVEPLVVLLNDRDEDVQKSSIAALRALADDRAIVPLINYLTSRTHRDFLRGCAAWALGGFRDTVAIEALDTILQEEADSPYVRL